MPTFGGHNGCIFIFIELLRRTYQRIKKTRELQVFVDVLPHLKLERPPALIPRAIDPRNNKSWILFYPGEDSKWDYFGK